MIVNNNVPALRTFNAVTATNNAMQRSIQKLSTGLRINSAADDAAGLAISEKMRAQVRGLDRAVMNAQDGISMIQTAEGALVETHAMLQRMRELSIQAANDTLTQQDRSYIQLEIDQLREEITRVGNTTQFNTRKLLDGSAAVNWTSSDLSVRAIINGGLRTVDQFGQKGSAEGNFRIRVEATEIGQSEQLKTNIFRIKHNTGSILTTGSAGTQVSRLAGAQGSTAVLTFTSAGALGTADDAMHLVSNVSGGNWQIGIQVDSANGAASATITATYMGIDGRNQVVHLFSAGTPAAPRPTGVGDALGATGRAFSAGATVTLTAYSEVAGNARSTITLDLAGIATFVSAGATTGATMSIFASSSDGANTGISVNLSQLNPQQVNGVTVGTGIAAGNSVVYNFVAREVQGQTISPFLSGTSIGTGTPAQAMQFSTDFAAIGEIAQGNTRLRDLQQFWNSEGRFMLDDPQTLTFTLGNGRSASFTIYGDNTLNDLVQRIRGLGEGSELGSLRIDAQFAAGTAGTGSLPLGGLSTGISTRVETSVPGTIVLTSNLSGAAGRMSVAGSEEMIRALGLSNLRTATETRFEVLSNDAHDGTRESRAQITGERIIGLVHPNVDVVFDSSRFRNNGDVHEFYLHLADNTTVFQIGANEGEDMGINIGDMRSEALGLNGVLVTNREAAARSITIIDNAIDRVSMQRARLGAYQNRLEHTISNLSVAGENLTAAESRIRDTDMAREMMNFTRLSIMLQAGTSMLAQANQMPQAVLGLIR